MSEPDHIEFAQTWAELSDLSSRIFQRGFDTGTEILSCRHEVRGLASLWVSEEEHFLIAAGDKAGYCHLTILKPGSAPTYPQQSFELPPAADGRRRVIDEALITRGGDQLRIFLATRGNGVWSVDVPSIHDQLLDGHDVRASLVRLPGSAGRKVRNLILDAPSESLLALADHGDGCEFFRWSLATDDVELNCREPFDLPITCMTIDHHDQADRDLLFVATGHYELFSFEREAPRRAFAIDSRQIEEKSSAGDVVWKGRLSPILKMRALSDIGGWSGAGEKRTWCRAFDGRGVFAMTLRHLVLIERESDNRSYSQARLVVGETKNLDISLLNFPGPQRRNGAMPSASPLSEAWHGVAISTLEGKIRLFRPSGLRRPEGDHDSFDRQAPEYQYPSVLISGYADIQDEVLPDRVYSMLALAHPKLGGDLALVLGMGDNVVRWYRFESPWRLRRDARQVARRLVDEADSIDTLLTTLQQIALRSVFWQEGTRDLVPESHPRRDKHTLLELLPRLWRRFERDEHWQNFYLLIWDILARRTPRYVAVGMIQALRRVQLLLPEQYAEAELRKRHREVEQQITKIRKFILDPGHFSKKRTRFLELLQAEDPGLEDERAIYRSILMARRHDPVFLTHYDQTHNSLGEIVTFQPLPPVVGVGAFYEVEDPRDIRFVTSNYSGALWLLDGSGRARPLIHDSPDGAESLGYIQTTHVHEDTLLLGFSEGRVGRLDWRRDLPPNAAPAPAHAPEPDIDWRAADGIGRGAAVTAFLSIRQDDRSWLLWGDSEGRIGCRGRDELLQRPPASAGTRPDPAQAILQLAWLDTRWPSGQSQPMILATTAAGLLRLFLFIQEPATSTIRLKESSRLSLGSGPIATVLVTGDQHRDVVIARFGTAVGLKVLGHPEAPRLAIFWAFGTDDTIRSIQAIPPFLARDQGPYRILVGSHDAHLHALDLEGRHLETYSLRLDPLRPEADLDDGGFKIGLFVVAPPVAAEDTDDVLLRVYGCAFENQYMGLRLVDRPRMLESFERDELATVDEDRRELRLTRWRAFHVDEGHLRHRFIRQSRRYPSSDPEATIHAIQWLIEAGNSGYEPTGELTALLRRLFQTDRQCSTPRGLDALLATPSLYHGAVQLLKEIEQRWDTPNSLANQRLLMFWIRSLLREIDCPETLRSWLRVSNQLALQPDAEPLTHPVALLRRYLEQGNRLVQYKTLQYLERMLFGWPGKRETALLDRQGLEDGDLDWFFDVLFSRLALRPEQVREKESNPVVLQIGRLLCLSIRSGLVDALYVSYLSQRFSIHHRDIYRILEDQWQALYADDGAARVPGVSTDPLEILSAARNLDQSLAADAPLETIVRHLEVLADREWPASRSADADYLREAPEYFRAILPLLRIDDIAELSLLSETWSPPPISRHFEFCPSYETLAHLGPLLQAVHSYHERKLEDLWGDEPMTQLRFEDFDRVQTAWLEWSDRVRQLLIDDPPLLAQRETRLIETLLKRWHRILIHQEKGQQLLRDFQQAVHVHLYAQPVESTNSLDPTTASHVIEEKRYAFVAFRNFFTRLLLMAEPDRGVFLFHWREEGLQETIRGCRFERGQGGPEELDDSNHPAWLPADCFRPETFVKVTEAQIRATMNQSFPGVGAVYVERIAGAVFVEQIDAADDMGPLAYYIFQWNNEDHPGRLAFEEQSHVWMVPLLALVYRRAALEHVELRSKVFSIIAHNIGAPVFHLRSDLRMLSDGYLEGVSRSEDRFAKYAQLLRQARHLDGIIDGVLSLSGRELQIQLVDISIAKLTHDVVRTLRREAKARRIEIDFPAPASTLIDTTMIHTDEPKVYDILLNLLNNAVKYSPIGGHVEVAVTAKHQGQRRGVEVRIKDQGPGIPLDERRHIYREFFRGSNARETASGFGLGLYVVKLYTERLRGHINHQNQLGGGSLFTLYLPDLADQTAES